VALGAREDLRDLPLLTIDPADARDHDDAVCALPEGEGFAVWVAIADVAHYVRPGSALDRDARKRGNSAYFPDRVAPMLPEGLSADLCSLHEGEDRPCIALRMLLDAEGRVTEHRFARGLMRSAASLTYEQAQGIEDGADHALAGAVRALFAAYRLAKRARDKRAPLDLDLPERRVELNDEGQVARIAIRERFDAHRLIEEFMILANVAAAETLEAKRRPLIYRVHEEPADDKLDALREQMETVGLTFPKGEVVQTRHFNRLLESGRDGEFAELVNLSVLRAQTQAYYSPQNFGHFGLNLRRYAHFTSPIRRYADLIVHRALIAAHGWGDDGLTAEDEAALAETAEHISATERRAMEAERDTTDRYLALFLAEREGAEFEGRVSGVARFGLFVKLDETGADGIVPVATLGREYWRFDSEVPALVGEKSGRAIGLGARVRVRLVEAAPVAGALRFEMLSVEESGLAQGRKPRGRSPKRKLDRAKLAAAKAKRKAKRVRR
jgi:ribonuclease R